MRLAKKKVLITGATGFIGSLLTRRCLQEGAQTHILMLPQADNRRLKDIRPCLYRHRGDLLHARHLNKIIAGIKPDIIFHLAAYGIYAAQKDSGRIMSINFLGTKNLIDACCRSGFKLFVNTGSVFEYGIKTRPLKETDSLEPITDYGVSKAAATLYCQALAERHNLPVITLRLCTPYGYFEETSRFIPSVILAYLKNKRPKLSSPRFVRDFIFIADVVEAYVKTAERCDYARGQIFNIGSGRQYHLGEVVDTIMQLAGSRLKPQWGCPPRYARESNMWQANITKAKRLLNWQPDYTLKEGLSKTIQWFIKNKEFYRGPVENLPEYK